jgi:hypothetical protein
MRFKLAGYRDVEAELEEMEGDRIEEMPRDRVISGR